MQAGRAHHSAALAAAVPAAGGGGLHHPAHRAGPAGAPRPGTRRGSRHMHPGEQCTALVSASVGAKAELGCMRLKAPCATNQATWRASSAPAKEVDIQTDTNKTSVLRAPFDNRLFACAWRAGGMAGLPRPAAGRPCCEGYPRAHRGGGGHGGRQPAAADGGGDAIGAGHHHAARRPAHGRQPVGGGLQPKTL